MSCGSNIFNETTGDNIVYECGNIGTGLGLFSGESVTSTETTFNFKSLVAGSNVNLTSTADEIEISSIDTGVTTLSNNGGFAAIGQNITGSTLNLRTITGVNGMTATQNTDNVTIGSTQSITSLGAGQALLTAGLPNATIRSLVQGTGISIASNANTLTINNTGVVTVDSIGGGASVSAGIVGPILSLRSFVGTGAVNVSQTPSIINISSPVLTLSSQPGGFSLINTTFPSATLKSLIAGAGISIVDSAGTITINNTQTAITGVVTLGSGSPVLLDVLGSNVRARGLVSQGYALVNVSGNDVTIGARGPVNIGTGEPIYAGNVGFDNQYKSLLANGNIQVTSDPSNIYFRPYINNLIEYSGVADMNTRVNGNPDTGSYLGFGRGVVCQLLDQFPAELGSIDGEFIGWVSPYTGTFKSFRILMRSLTNVTITERVDVYASLHRTKGDPNTLNIWEGLIQSYDSNISIGDFVQRTIDIGVSVDPDWGVYCVIYCQRPSAGGEINPLSFSVACSALVQSQDAF